ncbi:right-handed parallel beta-helix repeat-containing protein [Methanobrevibacter sp. DSM 116169]|uniref:right-handed parallel beta-helix repeat-containing protein n=1 Tax=Methanobrevibacter sp. DSM 116169 TaxID=3242727 RepID=UPI0038FC6894
MYNCKGGVNIKKEILILSLFFVLFFLISGVSANTYNVSSDMNHTDVQNYINIANDGDTIEFVDNGDYFIGDTINVNKSVNLISNNNATLKGHESFGEYCFRLSASNITISGLNFEGFTVAIGNNEGEAQYNLTNIVITNNIIKENSYGIIVYGINTYIYNNTVIDNMGTVDGQEHQYKNYGITTFGNNATIINNIVEGNKYGIANYAVNASILNNTLRGNGVGSMIFKPNYAALANTYDGIGTVIAGNIIENNVGMGIRNDCDHVIIENNTLINNTNYGIKNQNTNHDKNITSNYVLIKNNIIKDTKKLNGALNGHGIYNQGFNCYIEDNTIFNNAASGIEVSSSGDLTLINNNTIYQNEGTGAVFRGMRGTISNNNVYDNNKNGVQLYSSLIALNGNNITNNSVAGVLVQFSNAKLNIFNNSITYNNIAIDIYGNNNSLGILNDSISMNDEYYNIITLNDNGVNVRGNSNIISHLYVINNTGYGFNISKNYNNNYIASSNILGNNIGIISTGYNNTYNYNRIYKNKEIGLENTGNNTNANLNWWGRNDPTDQLTNTGDNLNFTNWYVLELSAGDFNTTTNATINASDIYAMVLSYKLSLFNGSNNNDSKLPHFLVTPYDKNGKITTGDIRITSISLIAQGEYEFIRAISDDEDVILEIKLGTINLNKTVNKDTANIGDNLTYTITIYNNGTINLTNLTINDSIPIGLDYISFIGNNWEKINDYNWIYNINLKPGESTKLTLLFKVNGDYVGITNNTIFMNTNQTLIPDNTTSPNTNLTNVIFEISKVPSTSSLKYGDSINYTINIKNIGLSDASNIELKDYIPNYLSYLGFTGLNWTYNNLTNKWIYENILKSGEITQLTLIFKVENNAPSIINNTVNIGSNQTPNENITSNNTNVLKLQTITTINNVTAYQGDTVTFNGTVYDEKGNPISGNITMALPNGENVIINVIDGAFSYDWTIPYNFKIGVYGTDDYYKGNNYYESSEAHGIATVLKLKTITTVNDVTGKVGDIVTIYGTVYDEKNNPVREGVLILTLVDGSKVNVNVLNGIFSYDWTIPDSFIEGKYPISAEFIENDHYYGSSAISNLIVIAGENSIPNNSTNETTTNNLTNNLINNHVSSSLNENVMKKTGNPLAILLIAILSSLFIPIRRKL